MSLLDVSDLLSDPDLGGSTFSVIRVTLTEGANGRVTPSEEVFEAVGSVQPAGESQALLADGTRATSMLSVLTAFALRTARPGQAADLVEWEGNRYTVAKVSSYGHFGAGHVQATCELQPLVPT